jgi:plastocyanin
MIGITERVALTLAAVSLMVFVGAGPVAGQEPGQEPAPSQQQLQVQGSLTAVDTDAMTITVGIADGQTVQFRYTDETEVSGAQDSIAGLATTANAMVTVTFTEEGETRTATRIEVQPAQ